jgi:hypothetical protein
MNGMMDNTVVDDAGNGQQTSTRVGITLDKAADGGLGVVGRVVVVHGIPLTEADGGPKLDDAGNKLPPPAIGCGPIQLN